ncbi:MAG TPA: CocE/NonD family hydrolase [Acidimicrobiales bacterium]|nr:CocE/NonD family hydrolase [Acidimicrobiales bacterium]
MRSRAVLLAVAVLAALVVLPRGAQADPPTHRTGYIPVAVGTLDEALLHYKVMTPDPAEFGEGPYPTVIDYSGYLPALNVYDGLDDRFIAAGYAVVGLNIRGSACSSGKFDYFEPRQSIDGVEAIDWLADQRWSNGDFAMVGKSYPGITQLFVAGARAIPGDEHRTQEWVDGVLEDHLAAIVPGNVFADLYRDVPYPGGIQNVTFAGGWSAQRAYEGYIVAPEHYASGEADEQCLVNQAEHALNGPFNPFVQALQPQNNFDSEFFHERSPFWFADEIDTPMFLVESWQDEQVGSRATHILERLRPDLDWKFLGTNGDHGEYYGPDVFPHITRFLDYHLRRTVPTRDQRTVTETETTTSPVLMPNGKPHPVRTETTTETTTRPETFEEAFAAYLAEDRVIINWEMNSSRRAAWTTTHEDWPVPELTADRLYATADGGLVPTQPGVPGSVDYVYSPEAGSQERGGYELLEVPAATWDDRPADGMSASFTTEPLSEDKVLLGTASIDLHLSSTAPDTDLEVTLSEVRSDGREVFVQQGWLRASHRAEHETLSTELRPFQTHQALDSLPLVPGVPSLMRVEIFPFGHVFRAGSQVRVTVAAPHVHPDLWGFTALPLPAVNTVHTGGVTASSVALPLVSGATAGVEALPPCGGIRVLRNQPCRPEQT